MPSPATILVSVALACLAAAASAQTRLVWNQTIDSYATCDSSTWRSPSPYDVEAADDFEFTGDVHRVIARGDDSHQSTAPSYAW